MGDADFELGQRNIEALATWYEVNAKDRNEATTRLQMIDRILFDCLGWEKEHVAVEDAENKEYTDYTFIFPRRLLIVEAKREGTHFELPVGHKALEYSIVSLFRTSRALRSAMEQVGGYCQRRGVPFGAVSNGHQIVAFIASRDDGRPPYEGSALVFPSLGFMVEQFVELWNALSRPAVEDQRLRLKLLGRTRPRLPVKLSARIAAFPGTKSRNTMQASLQDMSELILEDLVRTRELEPTFIRECYSQSGALSQHAQISRTILRARYAALFDSQNPGPALISVTDKHGVSPELLAEGLARRPILLIGDVGVGKTTFIRNLLYTESEELKRTAVAIYLDLGRRGALALDLKKLILDDIERELFEKYQIDIGADQFVRSVYGAQLGRFQHSPAARLKKTKPKVYEEKEVEFLQRFLSNREEHLRSSLEFVSHSTHRQILIFLDNTDQRNDRDQEDAFLIAQEMSEQWSALVFLPLRPETFHASRQRGALTGYHTRAFTVSPPRIDHILRKRLSFGLKITRGEYAIPSLPAGVTVRLEGLQTLIECFLHSLDRSEELIECIDNIASGNVRTALDLVRDFFGSGHVDTQKIIEKYRYDDYVVPLHEFLRAVIYGDNEYYNPGRSLVANLFDLSALDPKEHFLLPCLLSFVHATGTAEDKEGFIEGGRVYERFQSAGFTPEQIDGSIVRAHAKRLVDTAARVAPTVGGSTPRALRVTSAGAYHVRTLVHEFAYVDAVVTDTPITHEGAYHLIVRCEGIRERLERANAFLGYLDQCWKGFPHDIASTFDWNEHSNSAQRAIRRIQTAVEGGEGHRRQR